MKVFGIEKMKWILPAVLFMAIPAGCIVYYEKPGKTTADFNRDKKSCEAVAERESVRKGTRICEEIDRCLVKKGWKRDR